MSDDAPVAVDVGAPASVDICVCTFRRPQIEQTLRSLAALTLKPGRSVTVVVADNDNQPTAQDLVVRVAAELRLSLTYVHAPAENISIARNACLDACKAPLAAFIDDDEIAESGWLEALIAEMDRSACDVVLGPVCAVYSQGSADWLARGDFHSTRPVWVHGRIITGYTCNVLFRRTAPSLRGLRYRIDFGRSGGEDTAFFSSVHRAGGSIGFAPDALVMEPVAASRANMRWLIRRRFRFGETHAKLLLEQTGSSAARYRLVSFSCVKILFFVMAVCVKPWCWRYWLLRSTLHAGVLSEFRYNALSRTKAA